MEDGPDEDKGRAKSENDGRRLGKYVPSCRRVFELYEVKILVTRSNNYIQHLPINPCHP